MRIYHFHQLKRIFGNIQNLFKNQRNSNSTNPELLETRIGVLADPMIKSRNEPVNVGLVAQIICGLHDFKDDTEIENFIDTVFENSCQLFKT